MFGRNKNTIYRLLPCNRYDILAIEAWLEDMAAEGYMLKKFCWLGAVFEKREPMKVRYRVLLDSESNFFHYQVKCFPV